MKTRQFLFSVLSSVAALAMAFAFQSCSSDKVADAGDILSTVPSDVSLVAVINSGSMLEKTDCKVADGKITPSKKISEAVAKIQNPQAKNFLTAFINGQSGIDPSVMVLFKEGYNTYLTGVAADPESLEKTLKENGYEDFSTTDGIKISQNAAIAGNRFWVNVNSGSIDLGDVRHFNTLDKTQSFLQNSYADELCQVTSDISGWGNIAGLLNTGVMSFENRAYFQIALQTIFEDPSSFIFNINSEKGAFVSQFSVINSKGKNAKFQLPADKVDIATIKSLGGNADLLAAFSIPKKLIDNLRKDTKSKTPSVFDIYLQQLGSIDGTIAFCAGANDGVKGIITTTGRDTSGLSSLLTSLGFSVVLDGKMMQISKGSPTGSLDVAETANDFKGAVAGIYTNHFGNKAEAEFLKSLSVMLNSEGGGIVVKIKAATLDPKENALLSIMK